MPALFSLRSWCALSAAWVAAIIYRCTMLWPRLPLDVSANDPSTLDAFHHAITSHVLLHAGLAAGPPLIVLLIGRMLRGAR